MRSTLFLFFCFACLWLSAQGSDNKISVGVITMAAHGHLNPIITLLDEIKVRGHNILFMSAAQTEKKVEKKVDTFYPLGNLTMSEMAERVFGEKEDWGLIDAFTAFKIMEKEFLTHLMPIFDNLKKNNELPDVLIVDFLTFAGLDIGDHFNIPVVVSFPGLGGPMRFGASWQPGKESGMSFLTRAKGILSKIPIAVLSYIPYYWSNEVRAEHGIKPWDDLFSSLLVNKITFQFGFSPLVEPGPFLIGPTHLLGVPFKPQNSELSEDISKWFREQGNRKIIYISFGTVAKQSPKFLDYFVNEVVRCSSNYSFIWSLRDEIKEKNPAAVEKIIGNKNILQLSWVNQPAVLQNVDLFVTHGGYNSLLETVYYATPIVCMPFFADQPQNCDRAEMLGFSLTADKDDFQADLCEKFDKILNDEKFSNEAAKLSEFAKVASKTGISQAIDVLELIAQYGEEPLMPLDFHAPHYARFDYDIYACYFFASFFLGVLVVKLCCTSSKNIKKSKIKEE